MRALLSLCAALVAIGSPDGEAPWANDPNLLGSYTIFPEIPPKRETKTGSGSSRNPGERRRRNYRRAFSQITTAIA